MDHHHHQQQLNAAEHSNLEDGDQQQLQPHRNSPLSHLPRSSAKSNQHSCFSSTQLKRHFPLLHTAFLCLALFVVHSHSSGYDPGYYKGNRPYGGGSYGSYDPSYHSPQQQQQYSSGYDYVPPPPPPPSYSQSYTPYRKYYKQYLPGPQFCPETGRTVCSKVAPFYPIDEVFSVVKMARAKRFNISSEFVDESENDPEPNLSEEPWPEPEPFLQHSLGGHSFGGGFNVPQQPIAHFHNFDYKPYYGEKYRATAPPYHHQQRSIYANSYSGPHELGAYASASAVAVSHSRYKRQAGGGGTELPIEPVCPSRMILIEPKAALNDKRQWKFVVNLSERDPRLKQAIKVEVCT